MTEKGKLARDYFARPNTNCAQAVLCAFCEESDLSEETAMKISTGLGGGVRDKEVCGAVLGAILALGLIKGQTSEDDIAAKQKASDLTVEFNKRFKEKHSSIVCRDLKDKKEDYCAQLVQDGAEIMEELLKN
jgi:C_GCAxxG_C_C family probable redox protein